LPNALAIDVPYETFWHLNPKKLKPFYTAYARKKEEMDALIHSWVGNYGISALIVSISRCFSKKSIAKYIKKPLLSNITRKKFELSEYEKQKQVDLFFAQEEARRVNWRRKHKKKNNNN
jgi:hypothetical protein